LPSESITTTTGKSAYFFDNIIINDYLSRSKQQDAFLKGHFEDFMKKHGLRAPSIFDDDAHLSADAVEIYFKPGTNPLGVNESVLVSSRGHKFLTTLTLK